jgi:uncharacterized membrane protein HdeD (DUF308 family)
MLTTVCRRWWILFFRGLCAIALGISAIAWPEMTMVSLVILFAIFCLIEGIGAIVLGFRGEADGTVWWTMVFIGIIAVGAGIATFYQPLITAVGLVGFVAAYAIVRGIFEIAAAIRLRKVIDDEWVLGISGALSIIFGILIISHPGAGMIAIVFLIGAYMLILGSLAIALSLRLRKIGNKLATAKA